MTASLAEIPLEHSFFRNKVLVVCGMWRALHSVHRNFSPYVRALQSQFQVLASASVQWFACGC